MKIKPGTRLTALYLFVQGILGLVWWIFLWGSPTFRMKFRPASLDDKFVLTYAIADGTLFVLLSLGTAYAYSKRTRYAGALLTFLGGAVFYAFLHTVGLHLQYGGFIGPVVIMGASSACTLCLAMTSSPTDNVLPVLLFRVTKSQSISSALFKTFIQMIVFWTFFLYLIPRTIVFVERSIGIKSLGDSSTTGWALFSLAGCPDGGFLSSFGCFS